jgi:hypothetical protein
MMAILSGNLILKFLKFLKVLHGEVDVTKIQTGLLLVMLEIDVAPGSVFVAIEALSIFINPVLFLIQALLTDEAKAVDDEATVDFIAPLAKTERYLVLRVHDCK